MFVPRPECAIWVCHECVCGCGEPRAGANWGYKQNYGSKMGAIGGRWRKTAENGTPWSNRLLGENPGCLKTVTYIYGGYTDAWPII